MGELAYESCANVHDSYSLMRSLTISSITAIMFGARLEGRQEQRLTTFKN